MALILKIMSGENLPDEDTRKTFCIKSGVQDVSFIRDAEGSADRKVGVMVKFEGQEDQEFFELYGNAYLMNESGKTISSFGAAHPELTVNGNVTVTGDKISVGKLAVTSSALWGSPRSKIGLSEDAVTYNGAIPEGGEVASGMYSCRELRQKLGCPVNHRCFRVARQPFQTDGMVEVPLDDDVRTFVKPGDQYASFLDR